MYGCRFHSIKLKSFGRQQIENFFYMDEYCHTQADNATKSPVSVGIIFNSQLNGQQSTANCHL